MNSKVLSCFVLWFSATFPVATICNAQHEESRRSSSGKEGKRDQTSIIFTETSPGKFHGIQADSLGPNSRVTLSPKAEKEAILKELGNEQPGSNHQATENTMKETVGTESNDMSQYDNQDINLVVSSSSSRRHQNAKPVRLPSLTNEGKVDTVMTRSPKSNDTEEDATSKEMDSVVKILDLPDSRISEDDDVLPKSSQQLIGESDGITKLKKSGERFTAFYDHDVNAAKKVEQPSEGAATTARQVQEPQNTTVRVRGGQIAGGQITGGTILGGDIQGGFITGGTIKGGDVKGGRMTGGLMDGGILKDGTVDGGYFHNGTVEGGDIKGGNVTGGLITGGLILGGHVSAGVVAGGVLKDGGVEGGVLQGGTVDGGILKGGVMESGELLGGIVRNGRVTGGTILGGEVLGGEVGEGVVIRGGKINGTVTVGRKRGKSLVNKPIPQRPAVPTEGSIGGMIPAKQPQSQDYPSRHSNSASIGRTGNDAVVITPKRPNVVRLSDVSRTMEETRRTYERKDVFNRPMVDSPPPNYPVRAGATPYYSGVSYLRPNYQATSSAQAPNVAPGYPATRTFSSPLAIALPRSQPSGINIDQFVKKISNGAPRSTTDNVELKPDYHWILNQVKDGEVTGASGKKFLAKGGIRLNHDSIGFDGVATYMDGGDYAGTCVSDPNLCPRGLSVEMTIKVDPEATSYREPRYILDTGASSFNSRGVSLYTIDNKLRADVAIRDTAYCLVVPLTIGKWQDVVLTYHKNGELNMYINCKLVSTTENDEDCISCHTPGCHKSDENTKLMLGRSNNEPQSSYAKFKAGDLSIYERYLNPQDIDKICGFSKQKLSPTSENVMPASPHWKSPAVNSYSRIQPGFLKSGISSPQKNAQIPKNVPYFSPWSSWSICSSTCGLGTEIRQRSCIYTHAQSGWQTCHGATFQAKKCDIDCEGGRKHIQLEATTATRKDDMKGFGLSSFNSTDARNTSAKAKTTKIKVLLTDRQNDKANSTGKLSTSRRNRISKILSKLGNLLGKL